MDAVIDELGKQGVALTENYIIHQLKPSFFRRFNNDSIHYAYMYNRIQELEDMELIVIKMGNVNLTTKGIEVYDNGKGIEGYKRNINLYKNLNNTGSIASVVSAIVAIITLILAHYDNGNNAAPILFISGLIIGLTVSKLRRQLKKSR